MTGLWGWVAGIAFKLVGTWLDKVGADKALKLRWLEFVDAVDKSSLDSSKVLESYQGQLEYLRKYEVKK